MKRKLFIFGMALIAALALAAMLLRLPKSEKLAGKPVGFWLDEMNAGATRSNAAVAVFAKAGSSAVCGLTNELQVVPVGRNRFIELKKRLPWIVASKLPTAANINWTRRVSAANALGEIASEARPALPALISAVTTTEPIELSLGGQNGGMLIGLQWRHDLRAAALGALAKIDCEDFDALKISAQLAAQWDGLSPPAQRAMSPVCQAAMELLQRARQPDPQAIAAILDIVREQERNIAGHKLSIFACLTTPKKVEISYPQICSETNVLGCLQSADAVDRAAAVFALGDPERCRALKKPQFEISEQAVSALVEALNDEDAKVRLNAAETLMKFRQAEHEAAIADALCSVTTSANLLLRLRAVDCLARIVSRPDQVSVALRTVADEKTGLAAVWAKRALSEQNVDR
jgi:hypothetical protein